MKYKLKVKWSMIDIALYSLLWVILTVITVGIALLFAPYAWTAKVLNGSQLINRNGEVEGSIRVRYSTGGQIGHMLKWALLTIFTLGIAYPFYFWGAVRSVIDHAEVRDEV